MNVPCNITAPKINLNTNQQFNGEVTIASLRQRFYAMTGFDLKTIKITVNGDLVTDELQKLSSFYNGTPIDISIDGISEFGDLGDTGEVQKYEMSDAVYNARTDTVREMKRKAGIPVKGEKVQKEEEKEPVGYNIGDRCEVEFKDKTHHRGEVKYVGKVKDTKGYWIGIQMDEPVGKNDGSCNGERYFQCLDKYGLFMKAKNVTVGDFPPVDWEKELLDDDEL